MFNESSSIDFFIQFFLIFPPSHIIFFSRNVKLLSFFTNDDAVKMATLCDENDDKRSNNVIIL